MKLITLAPDLDPIEDGILLDCSAVVPTLRGIAGAPSGVLVNPAFTALAATCVGAASVVKTNGDTRTFAGTATQLYEEAGTLWATVTAATGPYTSVLDRWRFAQYGDVTLAVNKENVLQFSNGSGAFAAVTSTATGSTVTAPAAAIVEVINDFVFLGDTISGPVYSSDNPDRWWASALGDYQRWTPDIGVQCVTGRLTSVPGKITAIRKFGSQPVVYKERGMYLGNYVGPPVIWAFQEVPTANTGTWGQESVIALGTPEQPFHFFVGREDFYIFDGARPVPVGYGIKEYFFSVLNVASASKIICLHDRVNSLVYIYYPSGGSTTLNAALVFHYRTKKWGRDDRSIVYAFERLTTGVTYDSIGGLYSTYDDLASVAYDDLAPSGKTPQPSFFTGTHGLYALTGSATQSSITSRDLGTDAAITSIQRVTPRWITKPQQAVLTNYQWMASGDTPVVDASSIMDNGRFDILRSAAWHRFVIDFTGPWEASFLKVDASEDGYE